MYWVFYWVEFDVFYVVEGGGGSFYRNVGVKNSVCFVRVVIVEVFSGCLLLWDVGKLLGV